MRTALELLKKTGESVATTREQRTVAFAESVPVKIIVPWVIYDLRKPVGAVLRIGVGGASNSLVAVCHQVGQKINTFSRHCLATIIWDAKSFPPPQDLPAGTDRIRRVEWRVPWNYGQQWKQKWDVLLSEEVQIRM